jgi:TonB family protein
MNRRAARPLSVVVASLVLCLSVLVPVNAADEASVYLDKIERRIVAAWKVPPKSDGLKVTLRYNLARNGSISFVRVEKSSGSQSFDDSAVQAVRRASPFPAPPKTFPIGDLRMVLDPTLPAPTEKVPKPKTLPSRQQRI